MVEDSLRWISCDAVVLSRLSSNRGVARLPSDTPLEALYLYTLVPFQATHVLAINICIVPFSIPSHRGQLFYHAEAFYSQCCQSLVIADLMPTIASTAQRVYSGYISYHKWNFNIPDAWQHIEVPKEVLGQDLTCSERSVSILEYLVGAPGAGSEVGELLTSVCSENGSYLCSEQDMSSDESLKRDYDSILIPEFTKSIVKDKAARSKDASTILDVAERFLDKFGSTSFSGIAIGLHDPSLSHTHIRRDGPSEPAMQAFQYCKSIAVQAKEQLKHATFTRFVSLCFFLVWEAFACDPGKSGARVINAKMKEAGFEGTSRSLKTLREETIFINQLVASVEAKHGIGVSSLVLYHIFDSSNYHLIRLMNRYGSTKKKFAISRICERLDIIGLRGIQLPELRIHELIREHMPNLEIREVNSAVGYQEVQSIGTAEKHSPPFHMHYNQAFRDSDCNLWAVTG